MDYTNFLKAFDEMLKNANGAVKVYIHDGYGCRDERKKETESVTSKDGFIHWQIMESDSLEKLTDDLLKVESLIDEANRIRKYDHEMRMNHPNVFIALRERISTASRE